MNRGLKYILIGAIPIIAITSYLDSWLIGRMTWKEYLFQCAWEYSILWFGIWLGNYKIKKKIFEKKVTENE